MVTPNSWEHQEVSNTHSQSTAKICMPDHVRPTPLTCGTLNVMEITTMEATVIQCHVVRL